MQDTVARIIDKCLSARFLVTVSIIVTYCISILLCIYLVIKGKLNIEAFLGLFTAFSTLAAVIVNSYFKRDDRNQNGGSK
jgi:Na+-driven multidrug efflux pump